MSRLFSTLASQSELQPIVGVPRLIASRDWGTGDQTVLLEIAPVSIDNGAYYLSMTTTHGKLIEIKNNLGTIEFWFDGTLRASWAQGLVNTRLHITFDKNAATALIAFYKNNIYFTGFSSVGTARQHNFSGDIGVGGDKFGNNQSYNAATIFKILSGVYADFATADAVTGTDLIFNGLDF